MNRNKFISLTIAALLMVFAAGCNNKIASKLNTNTLNSATAAQTTEKPQNSASQTTTQISADASNKSSENTNPSSTKTANTAAQPNAPTFDKIISIGTTETEVKAMAGGFGSFTEYGLIHEYMYKTSQIFFTNVSGTYKVIGWRNLNNTFKFSVGDSTASSPPITLGSYRDQVVKCAGTPNTFEIPYVQDPNTSKYTFLPDKPINWVYSDGSIITFDSSFQVIGWYNAGRLRINYGEKIDSTPPIKLGSNTQDIVNALGTPRRLSPWLPALAQRYIGYSDCVFNLDEAGNVDGWINNGSKLINMGLKDPSAPPFLIGSPMENVIKAVGTPDKVDKLYTWNYGNSVVYFNNDWTVKNYTNSGNLKVK